MKASFWHERWEHHNIGFHMSQTNPKLEEYFDILKLARESRILVPLCGKTLDMPWLASQGMQVVGVELSPIAVKEFFESVDRVPEVKDVGNLKLYSAGPYSLFQGDIFELTPEWLGPIDAIYDRAALVALPHAMRQRYTEHLINLTQKAPQLLLCFTYDQSQMEGPPFSISDEEIKAHYESSYHTKLKDITDIPGGFREKVAAQNKVWHLEPK